MTFVILSSVLLQKDIPNVPPSPFPYNTANGKTVTTVSTILRLNDRWIAIQVIAICSRTANIRPPNTNRSAATHAPIGSIVETRTEKV